MRQCQRIIHALSKIMMLKTKHFKLHIRVDQAISLFNQFIESDVLLYFCMGSIRLQMCKWSLSGFPFDLIKEGNIITKVFLTSIKT